MAFDRLGLKMAFYLYLYQFQFLYSSTFMEILGNTSFNGVTGYVSFHGSDRYGPISVIQHLSQTDASSIYSTENVSLNIHSV